MSKQIRILLVDDHPMMRKGVAQLLSLEDDFSVIGEANSGDEAIPLIVQNQPDLVLLDLNMKGMSGVETLQAIKRIDEQIKVAIFTVSDTSADVLQAVKHGVDGYLLKDSEPEALVQCIRRLLQDETVVSDPLVGILVKALSPSKKEKDPMEDLTQREQEILSRIAAGNSNKEISKLLDITEATVKVHVKNLLRKLKLKSRVEAAVWVHKSQINRRFN